jgi:hypothetical protein
MGSFMCKVRQFDPILAILVVFDTLVCVRIAQLLLT